jgi:hypothetical protein
MPGSPAASGLEEGTTGQTPLIGRRFCQDPFATTPSGASSPSFASQIDSRSASHSTHDELVTRLRSALKALGGRPDATPPTSSNVFAADELEVCSRRVEPVPRMQSLDTEAEEEQVDQIVMRQVTLGAVEDDLQMRRSELAELETEIRLGERRLDELEGLATEGERIIEDQSRKASAAMKDLEWMEAELGRLSAEIVEVTARLDEKSLMLREAEALVSRSKRQAEELEGQRRLLEELERHNAATLDESRRLGRELDGLRQQKQEISFSLEPALMDALEELERSKAFARNLAGERGKAAQLELALEGEEEDGVERSTTTASGAATGVDGTPNLLETAGDLVHRLECERLASLKRTTALAEGTSWRRWRPSQIKAFRRNAAAC